jgi:simple sugar transport system ATP-binding protein
VTDAAADGGAAVRLEGIRKRFGEVTALDDVTLVLARGEVRALLGENGAGKSTLMNVLYGIVRPDAGRIVVAGEDVTAHWSTRRAIARGVGMIHQHFSLVGEHDVVENVILPTLGWRDLVLDRSGHRRRVAALAAEYGFDLPLEVPVEALAVGQRQQVEILKLLYQGARVLILDEPTSVLTPQQTDTLLAMLRRFAGRGHSVVLITHKLPEALAVADRITVLRQGAHVATIPRGDASADEVARMMVGQGVAPARRPAAAPRAAAALELRELAVRVDGHRVVDGVSLTVHAGEVLGVAGVAGNGQSELAEAILGTRRAAAGAVRVAGVEVTAWPIGARRGLGLAQIPEDRHALGMVAAMSVADNLLLGRVREPGFTRWGVLQRRAIDRHAREQLRAYDIRAGSIAAPMGTLSGGNQQKVVLSRELERNPQVVVACEPSRGLDLAATAYVRDRLVERAAAGSGVLLVSSDLDELMSLCHRIVVMFRGRIAGTLAAADYSPERLGILMAGAPG